jgi:hypothetical protein
MRSPHLLLFGMRFGVCLARLLDPPRVNELADGDPVTIGLYLMHAADFTRSELLPDLDQGELPKPHAFPRNRMQWVCCHNGKEGVFCAEFFLKE